MKFKANFQLPFFDKRLFIQRLDAQLTDLLVESAQQWLAEATGRVPVWSGAARSTFQELASQVDFAITVSPVSTAPDRRALGESEGFGDLQIDRKRGYYSFTYSTTLEHLIENETTTSSNKNLKTPTPYKFREAALRAWEQVAEQASLPGFRFTVRGRTYG